jgi:putative copper resistance protein D
MDPLLIATRALHYAGALSLVGVLGFAALIVRDPPRPLMRRLRMAAQLSAALVLVTAPLWLVLIGEQMSADTLAQAVSSGVPTTVLLETQFGHVLGLRFVLTLLLLPLIARPGKGGGHNRGAALLAAASVGVMAWQGHAGAELGRHAMIHLAADVTHLIAAGLWLGALLPLLLLLHATTETSQQYQTAKRFSTLGIICVAALLPSGVVNTYYLVGSAAALIATAYGQILLLKLVFVLTMLTLAGINRWHFLPRLALDDRGAARRIARHTAMEGALGLGVIAIVAALGTMEPAMHRPIVWPFGSALQIHPSSGMPAGHVHED